MVNITYATHAKAGCVELDDLPDDLEKLHTLEKAIICKRILFRNILIMPKAQIPKIKREGNLQYPN